MIDFRGETGSSADNAKPYINTTFFKFSYGDTRVERYIDTQYWSSTEYVSKTMNNDPTVFGVNFADGRIKGYPKTMPEGNAKEMFTMYVRGNQNYGINSYADNGDGTITDAATGLMWSKTDSGEGMNWENALAWVQQKNLMNYLGHNDWRLPNAKELQSIVDYTRSPDTTASAAIDPVFEVTRLADGHYPYFWTSTTHLDGANPGDYVVYISFGEALGYMKPPTGTDYVLMDVHGAGAQRSDPKTGDPADYPNGHGPQGDVIRIFNYLRLVRGGNPTQVTTSIPDQNEADIPGPTLTFLVVMACFGIITVLVFRKFSRFSSNP